MIKKLFGTDGIRSLSNDEIFNDFSLNTLSQSIIKNNKNLMNGDYVYDIDGMPKSKNYNGDMIKWCRELYWWGRKEGRYKSIIRSYND